MHQILDIKPEHEAIIVTRLETFIIKTLNEHFPHIVEKPKHNKYAFSQEESTLITDSSNYGDESSAPAPHMQNRSLNQTSSALGEQSKKVRPYLKTEQASSSYSERLPGLANGKALQAPIQREDSAKNPRPEVNERESKRKHGAKRPKQLFRHHPKIPVLVCLLVIAISVLIYLISLRH